MKTVQEKIESALSKFNSDMCNHKLLKRIENNEINIRNVMRYAVKKQLLPEKQWLVMDTGDSWRWLTSNPVDYNENELEETFEQTHGRK